VMNTSMTRYILSLQGFHSAWKTIVPRLTKTGNNSRPSTNVKNQSELSSVMVLGERF